MNSNSYKFVFLLLLVFVSISVFSTGFPGNISISFTDGDTNNQYWRTGKHNGLESTWTVADGHLTCNMADINSDGSSYRGDLMYNSSDGANTKGDAPAFTFNTTTDRYIAIKFIGDRPNGVLKFEMNTTGGAWLNTGGSYGGLQNNVITTKDGNKIYYLDLSGSELFIGESVDINFIKFIIADVTTEPFLYTIDWVATFASVNDIINYKNFADDGENDADDFIPTGVQSLYFTFQNSAENFTLSNSGVFNIADGHLDCTAMGLSGDDVYRADMQYNATSNSALDVSVIPANDKYIAIKFIGDRPNGALKFEMQKNDGSGWFNGYDNVTGSTTTIKGNTIYYFDLTTRSDYTGTDPVGIRRINFIIADAVVEPYSYTVDWIATFTSLDDLEAFKNYKDDGETDNDEDTGTVTILNSHGNETIKIWSNNSSDITIAGLEAGSIVNIYNLAGNRMLSATAVNNIQTIPFGQKGTFIVEVQNDKEKFVVKLIK